ncbi:hypothetical protein FC652_05035 [Vibrio sp. 05-20-BW147]|uniref:diacylglycerol/lipid kinase family protein n=1 Tax=Vibrio sp. 05-20-BW147 TaxID=2575834 RepID=UPI001592CAC0|nr:diacylglycerol kinase family protein [Vibrio sp. 05-20-BW147]NVC62490.1 hypothetical protein [Vibrio sp. 05-20-BW147]
MIWNFILNPLAGGGKALKFWQQVEPLLVKHKIAYRFHLTEYQGHARALSFELAQQGERAFVAIGGDGSVNELLQGLYESQLPLSEFVLTVAPQGTGNDWARYHKIPQQPQAWIDFLLRRTVVAHDLGLVSFGEGYTQRHVFINMAGCGLDCHILQKMGCAGGKSLRYYSTLLSSLYAYQGEWLSIRTQQKHEETQAQSYLLAMYCIGRYGGAGMDFSPDAFHQSGHIHQVAIHNMPFVHRLLSLPYLLNGRIDTHPKVSVEKNTAFYIDSERNGQFQCDGELVGNLPAKVELVPKAIHVLSMS